MKETVAEFTKRTGLGYEPFSSKALTLRPLAASESLPTLFRFPGGCGLLDHFLGSASRLAIPADDSAELWAAAAPKNAEAPGASHFGTIALLQPLRFGFSEERPGIFVGANKLADPSLLVWIPPSRLGASVPWDSIGDARAAESHLGNTDHERGAVIDGLGAYVRELEAVARAGVPADGRRWCDQREEDRLAALASAGITPSWTAKSAARTGL